MTLTGGWWIRWPAGILQTEETRVRMAALSSRGDRPLLDASSGIAFRAEFEIRLILWIVEVVWIVLAVLLWLVLSRFTGG